MNYYVILLIALVQKAISKANTQKYNGSFLGKCCDEGRKSYENHSNCSFTARSVAQSVPLQSICSLMTSVCCKEKQEANECLSGKNAAKNGIPCSAKNSDTHCQYKECCDACRLGIMSGKNGYQCSINNLISSNIWQEVFTECCQESFFPSINNATHTTQPTIHVTENVCLAFPGQLCGHVCVPTPGSYICACRDGFSLSADGKTCLQNKPYNRCEESNPCQQLCNLVASQPRCACEPGYELREDQKTCQDINECETPEVTCGPRETCINTIGSFKCGSASTCPDGFYFNFRHQSCLDVDECTNGQHLCNVLREKCLNLPGAYKCVPKGIEDTTTTSRPEVSTTTSSTSTTSSCRPGFEYDPSLGYCKDINECVSSPCEENEACENTLGAFRCLCLPGFKKNDISDKCQDINECQEGLHTCDQLHRCDNSIGSFKCTRMSTCGTGYTLNYNTGKCEDDDECRLHIDHCSQLGPQYRCVNTKGSFRCEKKSCGRGKRLSPGGTCEDVKCESGYKLTQDRCIDINECLEGPSPCKSNERCFNQIGTFTCQPKLRCSPGFSMNEFGSTCVDIDECAEGLSECAGDQKCVNRRGSYECQCQAGFRVDVFGRCEDVNECQTTVGASCGNYGECINTVGSFECNCKAGFHKSTYGAGCVDVNECQGASNPCQHHCANIWGSYFCTCNAGFRLNPDKRSCTDIDECEEVRGRGRLCLGICRNVPGSFACECPEGYVLDSDKRTCKDVNECENVGVCGGAHSVCVNVRGGHRCEDITCPTNFIPDPKHKNRCKRKLLCRQGDLDCAKVPLTYSYSFLPLASNMRLGPSGQADLFTMRGPLWSSTNVQFDLNLESAVSSKPGLLVATRSHFLLERTAFNQVVLKLIKPLEGPQEIKVDLNMKLYRNGLYEGKAVAKLKIYVSTYDF